MIVIGFIVLILAGSSGPKLWLKSFDTPQECANEVSATMAAMKKQFPEDTDITGNCGEIELPGREASNVTK